MKSFVRALFSVVATVSAVSAFATEEVRHFAPDNDLHFEDSLESVPNVDEALFNKVIDAALEVYAPIAKQVGDSGLLINRNWKDSTVNANCRRGLLRRVTINMYGGLARRPEITGDSFALVLCHELGHAYAGTPYIQSFLRLSAEGQSDYYGASTCLQQVLPKIPAPSEHMLANDNGTIREKCDSVTAVGTPANTLCVRRLSAGFGLGKLLAAMRKEEAPQYNTPDTTVVPQTLLSYPETTQCRLDTYLAGTFNMTRPACWFNK